MLKNLITCFSSLALFSQLNAFNPNDFNEIPNSYKSDFGGITVTLPSFEIENIINVNSYYSSGTGKNDLIIGRDKRDVIYSSKDNGKYKNVDTKSDAVFAGGGNDYIQAGRTTGVAYLDGGAGNDKIYGTSTNNEQLGIGDIINGGDGNDVIVSGAGDDIVYGGAGDDSFYNRAENGVRDSDNLYLYRGKYEEYNIYNQGGFTYIEDKISNRDGKDKIANGYREGTYSAKGDRVQFSDGVLTLEDLVFHPSVIDSRVSYNNLDDNSNDNVIKISNLSLTDGEYNVNVIEDAISSANSNQEIVFDLNGSYPISKRVNILKSVKLKGNDNFTLYMSGNDIKMAYIGKEGVTIDNLNLDGRDIAYVGIESSRANIAILNSKIYNLKYSDTSSSKRVSAIEIVPQFNSGDNSIRIEGNEFFNLVNTLHDDRRGTYGLAWPIFISYNHIDGANLSIKDNYIHNIDAEEDDYIALMDVPTNIRESQSCNYQTQIINNRLIGFTRRAIKLTTPCTLIENNIIESRDENNQTLYPSYAAIGFFSSNVTIKSNKIKVGKYFETAISIDGSKDYNIYNSVVEDNNITMVSDGNKIEFMLRAFNNVYNYSFKNNIVTLTHPKYDSSMFYLKASTEGIIENNIFNVLEGDMTSIAYHHMYNTAENVANKTRLKNNIVNGNVEYLATFQYVSNSRAVDITNADKNVYVEYYKGSVDENNPLIVIEEN